MGWPSGLSMCVMPDFIVVMIRQHKGKLGLAKGPINRKLKKPMQELVLADAYF